MNRPDVQKVLSSLKDFQRLSVDYVFSRFYTDSDRTHRFLLADEVGLGKTLVAKGVVDATSPVMVITRQERSLGNMRVKACVAVCEVAMTKANW